MSGNHKKAFVSWSGGKDSALACYNAMKLPELKPRISKAEYLSGHNSSAPLRARFLGRESIKNDKVNVAYLLNMLSENGTHSRSHHLSAAVLKTQAGAMGIPIVQRQATWGGYEEEFKKALAFFKKEGIQTGIFGDIDVQEHRDWVERVCGDCGLNAIFPLWQRSRESLMDEFIAAGFKAVIVAVKLECMGSVWLGRQLDRQFVEDMKRLPQVDLCGENGEFHTLVIDGPIFKRGIKILKSEPILKQGFWKHGFLDIQEYC